MDTHELAQLSERAEQLAQRAHRTELALHDLQQKYARLERDRNTLLAELRRRDGVGAEAEASRPEERERVEISWSPCEGCGH
jgi:hypothetical protein